MCGKGIDRMRWICYNNYRRREIDGKFIEYGALAQLVEHIVHIDGVTGSSPVSTTMNPQSYD